MENRKQNKKKKQYVYGAKEKPKGKGAIFQIGFIFLFMGVLLIVGIKTGFIEQVTKDLMSIDTKVDKSENVAKKADSEEKGVYVEGKVKSTWQESDGNVESYVYLHENKTTPQSTKHILYVELKIKPKLLTGETSNYIGLIMSERSYKRFKGEERIGYYLKGNVANDATVPK